MIKILKKPNTILNKIIITFVFLISFSFFSISVKAADQTVEMLNKLEKENMVFSKNSILILSIKSITCFSESFSKIDLLKFIRKLDLLNLTNIFLPKISEALLINGKINIG